MLMLFSLSFISTAHSQIAGPITCDTSAEGKIIFNDDENIPQFCNGTDWISLVGNGSPRTDCGVGSGLEWDGSEWVCTVAADTTPDAFSFTDETDVALSTIITSNSITINGIDASTPVSVSGDGSPEIRINGGSWVTSGSITDGQSLEVRLTSSGSNSTAHTATVDVGGVTDQWDVTTGVPDPCSGSPSVGTTCADGSIYAGTTVGGVPMYAAPADEGSFYWAVVNQNNPNARSLSDGQANHDDIVTNRPLSNYPAFEACEDLNVANYLGRDDWYLPAQDELDTLFDARNTGDFSGTFGSGWYWSSSEVSGGFKRSQRFSDGLQDSITLLNTLPIRCVRR